VLDNPEPFSNRCPECKRNLPLVDMFLLFDRAAGFLPPRPQKRDRHRAQALSRLAAFKRPPSGLALIVSSTVAMLGMSGLMMVSGNSARFTP
jgi:hypothetical protein